jgi:hypothetical protein
VGALIRTGRNGGFCVATLIREDRILTAAHCLPREIRRAGASCAGIVSFAFSGGTQGDVERIECGQVVLAEMAGKKDSLTPDYAVLQPVQPLRRVPLAVSPEGIAPGASGFMASLRASVKDHVLTFAKHGRRCQAAKGAPFLRPGATALDRVVALTGCPSAPGDSGSPILDGSRRVVGIVTGKPYLKSVSHPTHPAATEMESEVSSMAILSNAACMELSRAGYPQRPRKECRTPQPNFHWRLGVLAE